MRFKKWKEEEPTIGVAPFIDMVFLLLIFFMVTYQFDVASGVLIQLPKIAGKSSHGDKEKATLVIDKAGQVYLKGERLDMRALENKLRFMGREIGVFSVVIQADKSVSHGSVVEVMDVARAAGVNSIIIAAQWRPSKIL